MPAYLITYDLRRQRNYEPLIKQLRQWGCVSPLESVWFGQLNGPADTIRQIVQNLVDGDDGILVVQLVQGADWATRKVNENGAAWLQRNVAP